MRKFKKMNPGEQILQSVAELVGPTLNSSGYVFRPEGQNYKDIVVNEVHPTLFHIHKVDFERREVGYGIIRYQGEDLFKNWRPAYDTSVIGDFEYNELLRSSSYRNFMYSMSACLVSIALSSVMESRVKDTIMLFMPPERLRISSDPGKGFSMSNGFRAMMVERSALSRAWISYRMNVIGSVDIKDLDTIDDTLALFSVLNK